MNSTNSNISTEEMESKIGRQLGTMETLVYIINPSQG